MYVVSEILGQKFATVEECERAEKEYLNNQKKDLEVELNKAWEEVVKAVENFEKVSSKIEPEANDELKTIIEFMKMLI